MEQQKKKKDETFKGLQHQIKTSDYMKQNIKPNKTHYMYVTMLNKQLLIKRDKNRNDDVLESSI